MRVMTMSGGFRGLGSIAAPRRNAALDGFVASVQDFDLVWARLQAAAGAGQVQRDLLRPLEERYYALADQIAARIGEFDAVETEAQLSAWQSEATRTKRAVTAWIRDARRFLGEQQANRGLRIFLLAAASITVIGGASYVVYRATR